jgi:hypothetical protein
MHLRRIMSALVLAFAAGLSAACGDADEAAKTAASASASGSASPSVDVKADTERICTNVVAAFNNEKLQLLGLLLTIATEDDKAAQDKARADAAALVQRLKAAVDKETANAADPKVKTALQALMVTLGTITAPEVASDPDFDKKLDAAVAEAATYCPGLNA